MDYEKALLNLKKHGFEAAYFPTGKEAAAYLAAEVTDTTVGIGGCLTAQQLGLFELLSARNRVAWHWKSESRAEAEAQAAEADVYILSANALSETGEIVNIDGSGNRIASMFHGHRRVIFAVGVNKLTPDLPSAIDRARNVASPLNARRLHRKTPCALSEPMRCHDCSSPERICRGVAILLEKMSGIEHMEVLLIGEDLGY